MNTSLEEAMAEAYASVPNSQIPLDTLTISNPRNSEVFYICNSKEDHLLTLETGETVVFEKSAFNFTQPASGTNGRQDLILSVDNTDKRIMQFLVNAANGQTVTDKRPCVVTYRPYLLPDTSKPQLNPPLTLSLKGATMKNGVVSAKATFADILNAPFPLNTYKRSSFPNLGS